MDVPWSDLNLSLLFTTLYFVYAGHRTYNHVYVRAAVHTVTYILYCSLKKSRTFLILVEILMCGGFGWVVEIAKYSWVLVLQVHFFCCDRRHIFYWFYSKFIVFIYLIFVLLLVHWTSWSNFLAWIVFFLLRVMRICRVSLLHFHCIYSENILKKISLNIYCITHMHWIRTCIRFS